MSDRAPLLHIVMDIANDDEIDEVRFLFSGNGIHATIDAEALDGGGKGGSSTLSRHDSGRLEAHRIPKSDWIVLLHARVNDLIRFVGPSAFRETVEKLRTLRAVRRKASAAGGTVLLIDEDTGVQLDLEFQLPLVAYEDLASLNLRTFHEDPLRFERQSGPRGKWRPPR